MTNTTPNDTRELEIGELDSVSGGTIKGALEGVCNVEKASGGPIGGPMGMINEIMQLVQQTQEPR